jgi:hypothetical protein
MPQPSDIRPELLSSTEEPDPLVERFKVMAVIFLLAVVAAIVLTGQPEPAVLNISTGGVNGGPPPTPESTFIR